MSRSLRSLKWRASAWALAACALLIAMPRAQSADCVAGLRALIGWDPAPLFTGDQISARTPISLAWVSTADLLALDLDVHLQLSPGQRALCRSQADTIVGELDRYVARRFDALLERSAIESFDAEAKIVLRSSRRESVRKLVRDRELTYLSQIHGRLMDSLRSTHWSHYSLRAFQLQSWNPEWRLLLGREAPAAVEFASSRIALRPLEYTPDELVFFLFHELSHLAHVPPEVTGESGLEACLRAEVPAWRETLAYIQEREAQHLTIPKRFLLIREGASPDLEGWVRRVCESRGR